MEYVATISAQHIKSPDRFAILVLKGRDAFMYTIRVFLNILILRRDT